MKLRKAINTPPIFWVRSGEIACMKIIPTKLCRTRLPAPASGESRVSTLNSIAD
ncbi:hypothetical protein KCP78_24410 [Salmonella enterica subsp. enterica]|nr:hypothetical protein KCP78_24410 [Salmonella enterica subsp. enterica]